MPQPVKRPDFVGVPNLRVKQFSGNYVVLVYKHHYTDTKNTPPSDAFHLLREKRSPILGPIDASLLKVKPPFLSSERSFSK